MTTTTANHPRERARTSAASLSLGGLRWALALVGAALLALSPISSAQAQSHRGERGSAMTTSRQVSSPARVAPKSRPAVAVSTPAKGIISPNPERVGRVKFDAPREAQALRFAPRVTWEQTMVIAQAGEAPKKIHVDLLVIHASNGKKGYDPKVERFKKQLGFLSYTGFSLLNEEGFDLDLGETHQTTLFEGRMVETTLISGTDQKVRLKIKLTEAAGGDALVDTSVQVPRKGTFFVGGPKYKDGVLILPVTATY